MDICDALAGELLASVADNFFGARRQLEEMIKQFYAFVAALRQKETLVAARAQFLNYFLLRGTAVDDFYRAIKAPGAIHPGQCAFSDASLPDQMPFALTGTQQFIKLTSSAYAALQLADHDYLFGVYDDQCPAPEEEREILVNYNLVMNMCTLINRTVDEVNNRISPLGVLQYVKKFDPEALQREHITGAVTGTAGSSMDAKMAFQHIDFDSLRLTKYPEIPQKHKVESEISQFCKMLYRTHKDEIKTLLTEVKERIAARLKQAKTPAEPAA